jgi:hypothetical protein
LILREWKTPGIFGSHDLVLLMTKIVNFTLSRVNKILVSKMLALIKKESEPTAILLTNRQLKLHGVIVLMDSQAEPNGQINENAGHN